MSETKSLRVEWLAVAASALTLLVTLGGWVWWGGRLSQRVDTLEIQMQQASEERRDLHTENGKQQTDIEVIKAQYAEIISRLNRIDQKLDRP